MGERRVEGGSGAWRKVEFHLISFFKWPERSREVRDLIQLNYIKVLDSVLHAT